MLQLISYQVLSNYFISDYHIIKDIYHIHSSMLAPNISLCPKSGRTILQHRQPGKASCAPSSAVFAWSASSWWLSIWDIPLLKPCIKSRLTFDLRQGGSSEDCVFSVAFISSWPQLLASPGKQRWCEASRFSLFCFRERLSISVCKSRLSSRQQRTSMGKGSLTFPFLFEFFSELRAERCWGEGDLLVSSQVKTQWPSRPQQILSVFFSWNLDILGNIVL